MAHTHPDLDEGDWIDLSVEDLSFVAREMMSHTEPSTESANRAKSIRLNNLEKNKIQHSRLVLEQELVDFYISDQPTSTTRMSASRGNGGDGNLPFDVAQSKYCTELVEHYV